MCKRAQALIAILHNSVIPHSDRSGRAVLPDVLTDVLTIRILCHPRLRLTLVSGISIAHRLVFLCTLYYVLPATGILVSRCVHFQSCRTKRNSRSPSEGALQSPVTAAEVRSQRYMSRRFFLLFYFILFWVLFLCVCSLRLCKIELSDGKLIES